MKLILAVVSNDDANGVIRALTHEGLSVTKLATTGGFLMAGNTTIILGVEDKIVDEAIDIIKKKSRSRKQVIPEMIEPGISFRNSMPIEVNVGGATLFVLDIDRFEKI